MIRPAALLLLGASQALAQPGGLFTDPEDGAPDASEWLLEKKGFLPVPIVITEPAVGYGAGVALVFFRESIGDVAARGKVGGHYTPPDIYAVAMAATENGTRFGGAGGMVTFDRDRWRWRGGVGKADANLDFYGTGRALGYNLDGIVSSQEVMLRLGESSNFLTARWVYLDLEARFDAGASPVPPARGTRSSGLGVSFEHDSRDNLFTASRGLKGAVEALFYSPDFGGDNEFELYRAHLYYYLPMAEKLVLGTRLDARAARGDVPFYQLPYIELRGIPAVRYQDREVAVAELELRWNATPRWALVGFLGTGKAGETASAGGLGFRYLVARRLGIYMGLDLARGPEETAIYIQAGSAWR